MVFMKKLLAILFSALFFLPTVKGQKQGGLWNRDRRCDSQIITTYKRPIVNCNLRTYNPITLTYIPSYGHHPLPLSSLKNMESLSSALLNPKIKPNYIYLSWSEELKYTNFPRIHHWKQINKKIYRKGFSIHSLRSFFRNFAWNTTIKKPPLF